MKFKNLKIVYVCIAILAAGFFTTTNGQDYSDEEYRDKTIYICFDNSGSMKRYEFYNRLVGILIAAIEKNKTTGGALTINYVPFGTTGPVKILETYDQFKQYISTKTFATTDFTKLGTALTRLNNSDDIIIISDGEHDISTNSPFSHLTPQELRQMKKVVTQLDSKNIYSIHVLKQFGHNIPSRDLNRYIKMSGGYSNTDGSEFESALTDGTKIAGLAKDFMLRLARKKERYYPCSTNREAVNALLEIVGVPQTQYADISQFMFQVPIDTTFPFVTSQQKQWFTEELEQSELCISNVQRKIRIVEGAENPELNLNIEYVRRQTYNVTLEGETVWRQRRISSSSDMKKCTQAVKTRLQEIITNRFSTDPRFNVPTTLISVKIEDKALYTFLKHENVELEKEGCGATVRETAESLFFDNDQRIYISIPLIGAKNIYITAPGNPGTPKKEFPLVIPDNVRNSWESSELTLSKGKINYPTLTVDLSNFLNQNIGTLLFFSVSPNRFYDKVRSGGNMQMTLLKGQLYQIYFVPDDLSQFIIKDQQKEIFEVNDLWNAFALLNPTPIDQVFTDFTHCFKNYSEAKSISSKEVDTVTRQIIQSNGYFLLLGHLKDIKNNPEYLAQFKEILINTIDICDGAPSLFMVVYLIEAEVPGFSKDLKTKYLKEGNPKKMNIVIRLLSRPMASLKELKKYLDGEPVTQQNGYYFKELEK